MAQVKVSDLPAATSVALTDTIIVNQGGVTKRATLNLITTPINVKHSPYNAVGDGTTDDTAAIQAAFDAAATALRPVVFPDETYRVNSGLTLTQAVPILSLGQTFEDGTATIDYRGTGNCITLTETNGSVGWRVNGLLITMANNTNANLGGIYVTNGLVGGHFSNVKVFGSTGYNLDYGIRIRGNAAGANCTANVFENVFITRPNVDGIVVGDDVSDGAGHNTVVIGGIILSAKGAAIHLTGGQTTIIGGDHSAASTGVVVHYDGSLSQNNTIISTEMEMAAGSSHIMISNNASVNHVFTLTGGRGITTGSGDTGFTITDNEVGTKRQRWVATVGGPGWIQVNLAYLQGLSALATGASGASMLGTGGKFIVLKGDNSAVSGMMLLGNSTSTTGDPCFANSAAWISGTADTNAMRFLKTSDGTTVTLIGQIYPSSMGTEFQAYYLLAGRTTLPERGISRCAGSPEGAITASIGSQMLRDDGGASTVLYIKESGSGNTGWRAV